MGSSVAEFPVPQKTLTLDIKGNKTDLVICRYDDHIMVIVTQIGAMGTILHARKEEGVSIDPTFNVSVVFGKRDEPMMVACARQLIEHISNSRASRQLVLSLGLKDHSSETLKGVVSAVIENPLCTWQAFFLHMLELTTTLKRTLWFWTFLSCRIIVLIALMIFICFNTGELSNEKYREFILKVSFLYDFSYVSSFWYVAMERKLSTNHLDLRKSV